MGEFQYYEGKYKEAIAQLQEVNKQVMAYLPKIKNSQIKEEILYV